eukprot:SAG22_NODE_3898_length_1479_cov_1.534058_3_plen_161_part_01
MIDKSRFRARLSFQRRAAVSRVLTAARHCLSAVLPLAVFVAKAVPSLAVCLSVCLSVGLSVVPSLPPRSRSRSPLPQVREILVLTKCQMKHPHIVFMRAVIETAAWVYIVMELVEGGELQTKIDERVRCGLASICCNTSRCLPLALAVCGFSTLEFCVLPK